MKPRLSVAIMCVPERRANVERMAEKLDVGNHSFEIVEDTYHDGIWPTAMRARTAYSPDATHHLVLQDDLMLCEDLIEGTELALSHLEADGGVDLSTAWFSLCGTSEQQRREYLSGETSWFKANAFNGTAVGAPVGDIEPAIDWANRTISQQPDGDDFKLWNWCIAAGRWCYHTVPCLAEHAGAYKSTRKGVYGSVGGRELSSRGQFVGEDVSALSLDWTKRPLPRSVRKVRFEANFMWPGAEETPAW